MSFSSRRRNYLLIPHRRDGLIEWMKSMLQHSFVLDSLNETGADTFSHFELLIEEHRQFTEKERENPGHPPSRLKQLVPTIGIFHTALPLRAAYEIYNAKHKLDKRKHIQISFNEIRHILNLAQVMALRRDVPAEVMMNDPKAFASDVEKLLSEIPAKNVPTTGSNDVAGDSAVISASSSSPPSPDRADTSIGAGPSHQLNGPKMITFDGDQTLYSDGENFDKNPKLAHALFQLLRHGVVVAVVTAAGYEYKVEKYEYRLSGLLHYFRSRGLKEHECERFYLFGGECNYLLQLRNDFHLHPIREDGPGGWVTSTRHLDESPGNWAQKDVSEMLDTAEEQVKKSIHELNLRGRAIRKRRAVGLVPLDDQHEIPRESLDEVVLRIREDLDKLNDGCGAKLPFCAFNGGTDVWLDCGNKRVGVQILQSYLGITQKDTLHIGDQFLNTGNDYAARDVSPCIWIINPTETTYILKAILKLAGVSHHIPTTPVKSDDDCKRTEGDEAADKATERTPVNFQEAERRAMAAKKMDVYTGELK